MTRAVLLSAIPLVVVIASVSPAAAQVAPINAHPGATASASTPLGDYATAVPLDLPASRAGLPIPLSIAYSGGTRVGAAGAGWSVPLSYVRVSNSTLRRKPVWGLDGATPDRVFLSIGGATMLMTPSDEGGIYTPMVADAYLELEESGGEWIARNAAGQRFVFQHLAGVADEDVWFLARIEEEFGTDRVELSYRVEHDEDGNLPEILLEDVSYTYGLFDSSPLYMVRLDWGTWDAGAAACDASETAPATTLASWDDEGYTYRRSRIVCGVDVRARDNRVAVSSPVSIRSYLLGYEPDLDTGLPRLARVDVAGQDGQDVLPVATYEYGTATSSLSNGSPALVYEPGATVPRSLQGADSRVGLGISSSTSWSEVIIIPTGPNMNTYYRRTFTATDNMLVDMTGDGLPDLVYRDGDELWLVPNVTTPDGTSLAEAARVPLGADVNSLALESTVRAITDPIEWDVPREDRPVITEVWRQLVDWNGDGRPDIVDVYADDSDHWRLLWNLPDEASSDPYAIAWRVEQIAIGQLRQELEAFGYDTKHTASQSNRLPLSRSKSLVNNVFTWSQAMECTADGWGWQEHALQEPTDEDHEEAEHERVDTFVEWSTRDVNGDGFPDFEFDEYPVELVPDSGYSCASDSGWLTDCFALLPLPCTPGDQTLCGCEDPWGLTRLAGARRAMYNAAGVVSPANDAVFRGASAGYGGGSCAAALPYEAPEWAQLDDDRSQSCVLEDADGDGLLERVELNRFDNDRNAECADGGGTYTTRQLAGLVDLTGDGIPDYVHGDVGWVVEVGLGDGRFADPIPIAVDGFELSLTIGQCDGDAWQVAGLSDLDGDGRPELVRADEIGRIEVQHLVGSGGAGALDAGRIVAQGNGYGAFTYLEYRNAKTDAAGRHQAPHPEIVLTKASTVAAYELGESLDPVYYAYAHPQRRYDAMLARWGTVGYRQRITLAGIGELGVEPPHVGTPFVDGNLLIETAVEVGPFTTFEQYAIEGRTATTDRLEGEFFADPWQYLDLELDPYQPDSRWRQRSEIEYGVVQRPLGSSPAPGDECYDVDPFGGDANGVDSELCLRTGIVYARATASWTGTQPREYGDDNLATMVEIAEVDAYGRPTLVHDHGDWHDPGLDDVCHEIAYAPEPYGARPFTAVLTYRVTDCGLSQHGGAALRGTRYAYGANPALPERIFEERYDAQTGELLDDEWRITELFYDNAFNRVSSAVWTRYGTDPATHAVDVEYDAYGLTPAVTRTSSNVPDVTFESFTSTSVVPLVPSISTDLDGVSRRTYRDAFGRVTMQTVEVDGTELVVSAMEYDDAAAVGGRRVIAREFGDGVPVGEMSEADAVTAVTYLDELGRSRGTRALLGGGYAAEAIVSGAVVYDTIGRVAFAAEPFETSAAGVLPPDGTYGTTYVYERDGKLARAITDYGRQGPYGIFSNPDADRLVTVNLYEYDGGRLATRTQGPNERTSSHPNANAYDEVITTVQGRVMTRARRDGSAVARELAHFGYDRLGHQSAIYRYASPNNATGIVVWSTAHDSFGNVLRAAEPGSATVYREYDNFGNVVRESWMDGSVERAVVTRYDGFDRVVETWDEVGGARVDDTTMVYYYDAPSGSEYQRYDDHLLGRLSYASALAGDGNSDDDADGVIDAHRTIYYGYDALGHLRAEAHRDAGGGVYEQEYAHHLDGRLEALTFRLPDNAYQPEEATYQYDALNRLTSVTWLGENVYDATEIDAFGRPTSVLLGNGVTETTTYEPYGRRELVEQRTELPDGDQRYTQYQEYDADLRVVRAVEVQTVMSTAYVYESSHAYDVLNRLSESTTSNAFLGAFIDQAYAYDGLGNLLDVHDFAGDEDRAMSVDPADPDRLCRADGATPGTSPGDWDGGDGGILLPPEVDGIWIEAEQGVISAPMVANHDASASGGGYIWLPEGSGSQATDRMLYTFVVDNPGWYKLWGRVWAPDGGSDSFYVSIDGQEVWTWDTGVYTQWTWTRVRKRVGSSKQNVLVYLDAGEHLLNVGGREDGTGLDRLWLTKTDQTPSGTGPAMRTDVPVEAEQAARTAPMVLGIDSNASGGEYIVVPDGVANADAGAATFTVDVPHTGNYMIWARTIAPNGASDSFYVSVDGAPAIQWRIVNSTSWTWHHVRRYTTSGTKDFILPLTAGQHTIEFSNREDGTQLDMIALSTHWSQAPTGVIAPPTSGCQYRYDARGNTVLIGTGGSRHLFYDNRSRITQIIGSAGTAEYRYAPDGSIASLDTSGVAAGQSRQDRRYGSLVEQSYFVDAGTVTTRRIPAPIGIAVRGPGTNAEIVYTHMRSGRGTRFVTNGDGEITQEIMYQPYGAVQGDTGTEGSLEATKYQWNNGDTLSAFGLSQVGARLYDPSIGRFLQRDPLMIARTSNAMSPYGFSRNDPVNWSDWTGNDAEPSKGLEFLLRFRYQGPQLPPRPRPFSPPDLSSYFTLPEREWPTCREEESLPAPRGRTARVAGRAPDGDMTADDAHNTATVMTYLDGVITGRINSDIYGEFARPAPGLKPWAPFVNWGSKGTSGLSAVLSGVDAHEHYAAGRNGHGALAVADAFFSGIGMFSLGGAGALLSVAWSSMHVGGAMGTALEEDAEKKYGASRSDLTQYSFPPIAKASLFFNPQFQYLAPTLNTIINIHDSTSADALVDLFW